MKKTILLLVLALMLTTNVLADGLSVQLKRTNPGIVGAKPAELIFDVVNTDLGHKMEGFIWCRSPDDTVVSSSLGAATGSGAQYVSERFFMDSGPTQKAISIVLESVTVGDKNAGCVLKYAPYKETLIGGTPETKTIDYVGTIGKTETNVDGYKVLMLEYRPVFEDVETTDPNTGAVTTTQNLVEAYVTVSINNIPKELKVGEDFKQVGDLKIKTVSATTESTDVEITGKITVSEEGVVKKQFRKTNGAYVSQLDDSQYRELRLDKVVPFVKASKGSTVSCPEGQTTCTTNEVVMNGSSFFGLPLWGLGGLIVLIIAGVLYIMGKTSRGRFI